MTYCCNFMGLGRSPSFKRFFRQFGAIMFHLVTQNSQCCYDSPFRTENRVFFVKTAINRNRGFCSLTLERFRISVKFFHRHVGPFNRNTVSCQRSESDEPFSQEMRLRDSNVSRFCETRVEVAFCLLSNFATVLTICKILSLACRPFQLEYNDVPMIRIGRAILAENANIRQWRQ